MKKHYYILLLLVASRVGATNLVLRISDKNSLENLQAVSVEVRTEEKVWFRGLSDSHGECLIDVPTGLVYIECRSAAYEPLFDTLKDVSAGKKIRLWMEPRNKQMPDLVVTGQSTPVLARQSVYKVQTLQSSDIRQRAAQNMSEVLNYEMNYFVSNDNVLGSSVNLGGIGGQNIKVLVNGIPVMGRENGNIDLGQMNMGNVKRVEMIQGPMSVIYGSNALGGVINLITNTASDPFQLGLRTYLESIGKVNFMAHSGIRKGAHQLQLSMARNFFYGWTPPDSVDRYQLWKPKVQYLGDLNYTYTQMKGSIQYYGSLLNEKITNKGEPIINPYEGYAFDEYYRTRRYMNALTLNRSFHSNRDQLSFTNSYQIYHRIKNRLKKDLVTLNEIPTQSIGDQDTTRFIDFNSRGTYSSQRFQPLTFTAGYEYSFEKGRSYKLENEEQDQQELGLFASALYQKNKWSVQPSARYTYNNRYASAVSPALHLKYDWNTDTRIRFSYARGFRAPTLKELYLQFIDQNHTIIGNENLKPETGDHLELNAEHRHVIKNLPFDFNLVCSHNRIQNLITLAVFNNHGVLRQYANIREYKNWLTSANIRYVQKNGSLIIGGGFTYVEPSDINPSYLLAEAMVNISRRFKKLGTTFTINYKFNGRQPVITIDQQFLYTEPMHIANCSIQRVFLHQKLQVQAGLKNLFNFQQVNLNGNLDTQNNAHSNSGTMQVFPARSIFLDLSYSL